MKKNLRDCCVCWSKPTIPALEGLRWKDLHKACVVNIVSCGPARAT